MYSVGGIRERWNRNRKFLPDMKTGSNQKKCKKVFAFASDIFDKNNRIVVTEGKNP